MNLMNFTVKSLGICLAPFVALAASAQNAPVSLQKAAVSPAWVQPNTPAVLVKKKKLLTVNPNAPLLILDFKSLENMKKQTLQGPRTGGGGNSCSLAIVAISDSLAGNLQGLGDSLLAKDQRDRVFSVMKVAKFYLGDRLVLGQELKDAINYPDEGKIEISQKFCSTELIENSIRARSLLFHEYLGLAGIDDRQYQISKRFLDRSAELLSEDMAVQKYLNEEAVKDMAGKKSCFGGALLAKDKQMEDDYGGRYSAGAISSVNLTRIGGEASRQIDKYCDQSLDKNKKPTDDWDKTVYRICNWSSSDLYVVSTQFEFATSGSYGEEPILFQVEKTVAIKNLITLADDKDDVDSSEISRKTEYSCKRILLPTEDGM